MKLRSCISLCGALLSLLLLPGIAAADQPIDLSFSKDPDTGQEVLNARTAYRSHGEALRRVLMSFGEYASLHPWVTETQAIEHSTARTVELIIRFKFPWPVGQRWSQLEITQAGDGGIIWRQIDGNLKVNYGRLKLVTNGQNIDVDYSAAIDVGVPDAWARSFKKRFVSEFIAAAFARARATDTAGLTLAGASRH